MILEVFTLAFLSLLAITSIVAAYLAIRERDLVKAVVYSAIQSAMYALIYYVLMAPDIVLVYIPVSVGLVPAVLLFLIKKTERYEAE